MRSEVIIAAAALIAVTLVAAQQPARSASGGDSSRIRKGFRIAPVKLNLRGKTGALVGLGSYTVNAQGGCNDCHTNPPYEPGGDPHQGQPEKINTASYLVGG